MHCSNSSMMSPLQDAKEENTKQQMRYDEILIEFLIQNPCLWDKSDTNFRNRTLKDHKWKDIASKMNMAGMYSIAWPAKPRTDERIVGMYAFVFPFSVIVGAQRTRPSVATKRSASASVVRPSNSRPYQITCPTGASSISLPPSKTPNRPTNAAACSASKWRNRTTPTCPTSMH